MKHTMLKFTTLLRETGFDMPLEKLWIITGGIKNWDVEVIRQTVKEIQMSFRKKKGSSNKGVVITFFKKLGFEPTSNPKKFIDKNGYSAWIFGSGAYVDVVLEKE